ncbi:translocation/assembly module TamB domain-containing protein [Methyloversatilis thermotolerans]|uniref:translocation/assembly module TamB domain-containing protein n=1 Tax=Methyloversatilis thermotolerans TaxID=1346290 RepID=UPI000370A325|nr:translocation/assembly module TamB domain-containing protein [Methyloversatilis thermotolerans]
MSAPSPVPSPRAAPKRHWLRPLLLGGGLLFTVLPALLLWFALGSAPGLRALASVAQRALPALQIEVEAGALLSAPRFSSIVYDDGRTRVRAERIALDWRPAALLDGRLDVALLDIGRLDIATSPSDDAPTAPDSLQLPLPVSAQLRVGDLGIASYGAPGGDAVRFSGIALKLASDGVVHHLDGIDVSSPWGRLTGDAALKGSTPFALRGGARIAGLPCLPQAAASDAPCEADVALGGALADVTTVDVRARGAGLSGRAQIGARLFAPQPLAWLKLAVDEFDPRQLFAAAPTGRWTLHADLMPVDGADLAVAGEVRALNARPDTLDRGGAPVRELRARVHAQPDRVRVDDLEISLAGGARVTGDVVWRTQARPPLDAHLVLHDVDASALHRALARTRIGGRADLGASEERQTLTLDLRDSGRSGLTLHARGRAEGRALTLEQAMLTAGDARAQVQGRLTLDDARAFELRGALERVDPSVLVRALPGRLSASFNAAGRIAPRPDLRAALEFAPSTLLGSPLGGHLRTRLQGSVLSDTDVALDWAGNTLSVQGGWGRAQDVLQWTVDARKLGAARALTGIDLAGQVSGSGSVSGPPDAPSGRVQLMVRGLRVGEWGMLARADVDAELAPGSDGRLRLTLDASDLSSPQLPSPIERIHAELTGTRDAHSLQVDGRMMALPDSRRDESFQPSLALSASGALSEGPAWSGRIERLALQISSELSATLRAPARLAASPQAVQLDDARFGLSGDGELSLQRTLWTPERLEATGRARGVPLRLVWRDRETGLSVRAPLKLGADWSVSALLAGDEHVQGTLSLFRESGNLVISGDNRTEIALTRTRADVRLDGRAARIAAVFAGQDIGEMKADLHLPLRRDGGLWGADLDGALTGDVTLDVPSLAWVGRTLRLDMSTRGRLRGDVAVAGSLRAPRFAGRLDGDELAFALVDAGVKLERGLLRARFDGDRLTLQELSFESDNRKPPADRRLDGAKLTRDPGRLVARGSVEVASVQPDIAIDIHHFVPLQGGEQWLMLSGKGRLAGSAAQGLKLDMALAADAGLFTMPEESAPTLGDDVVIKGRGGDEPAGPPLALAIDVDLGERLFFKGRGLDTRLAGKLALRDDGRGLRATGSIRTVDGRYRAYGQDLVIERGVVTFQGAIANPGLNVRAIRPNLPVQAGVEVSGTVQRPRVRLVSDTAMPDSEKLSWIVLGRGQDRASGSDLSLLATAAGALLGGEGDGVTGSLAQSLGLDQIALTQSTVNTGPRSQVIASNNSSTTVGSQVVSVGKRLSSNAMLSYEQGVAGATSIVKLTWNLTRHLALIGSAGTEQAVDVRYVFSFK